MDSASWGDYYARLSERRNAEGVDLLTHADQHSVRLSLKAGPQAIYFLVSLSEFGGFTVRFRLSRVDSSGAPDVHDYLKTLDPNSNAYVTVSGMTQVTAPPFPMYYTSMRAANWTRPASLGPTVVVMTATSVDIDSSSSNSSSGSHSATVWLTLNAFTTLALARLVLILI